MTTASRIRVTSTCPAVAKFCESRPSPTMRRDEKIRELARSVQEITESEEEEEDSTVTTPRDTVRSPFALLDSPCMQRRCISLSSPLAKRRTGAPRLMRGLSDPGIRRPTLTNQPLSPKVQDDLLCLPPIPEATTPVTPMSQTIEEKEAEKNEVLNR